MMDRKAAGYHAEGIVAKDYISRGYELLEQNWTMRGGEIDLVCIDHESETLIFVEVKMVDAMVDDTLGYVTSAKLRHLRTSIRTYVMSHAEEYGDHEWRIDIVFVSQNRIYDRYESVQLL